MLKHGGVSPERGGVLQNRGGMTLRNGGLLASGDGFSLCGDGFSVCGDGSLPRCGVEARDDSADVVVALRQRRSIAKLRDYGIGGSWNQRWRSRKSRSGAHPSHPLIFPGYFLHGHGPRETLTLIPYCSPQNASPITIAQGNCWGWPKGKQQPRQQQDPGILNSYPFPIRKNKGICQDTCPGYNIRRLGHRGIKQGAPSKPRRGR